MGLELTVTPLVLEEVTSLDPFYKSLTTRLGLRPTLEPTISECNAIIIS